jgi:hypothetical protein
VAPGGVEPPEACGLLSAPDAAWGVVDGEFIAFINALGGYASAKSAASQQLCPVSQLYHALFGFHIFLFHISVILVAFRREILQIYSNLTELYICSIWLDL